MPALKTYLGTMQGPAQGLKFGHPRDYGVAAAHLPRRRPQASLATWGAGSSFLSGGLPSLWELPRAGHLGGMQWVPDQSLGLGSEPCWLFHLRNEWGDFFSSPETWFPRL